MVLVRIKAATCRDKGIITRENPEGKDVYMDFQLPIVPSPKLDNKEQFWIPGIEEPSVVEVRHFCPEHVKAGVPVIEIFVRNANSLNNRVQDGYLSAELIDLGWCVDNGKGNNPLNLYKP